MRTAVGVIGAIVAGAGLLIVALPATGEAAPAKSPPKPPPITVLHIGDSFVDSGLRQVLGPKLGKLGMRYVASVRTGSYIGNWAGTPTINNLYWSHRPSLIIVTLGASETRAIPSTRAAMVRRIVKDFKNVPCVWTGVPLWKGEPSAMNDMMRRESLPCKYFDPAAIAPKMARKADKAHPTPQAGLMWGEALWDFLTRERDATKPGWVWKR